VTRIRALAPVLGQVNPQGVPKIERVMRDLIDVQADRTVRRSNPRVDRSADIALCRRAGLKQCLRWLEAHAGRRR
jgi:hypothetical protein